MQMSLLLVAARRIPARCGEVGSMTYAPYAYLLVFGIVAVAIILLMDGLDRDRNRDQD